ncbi:MAG: AraC family transcriptional regulator [Erysipelotrichaceae bacterium]|nr:AraC family transcriptional regulator [Erysipelotrichaceae bacterium]
MSKAKELWSYEAEEKVWVGKYLNSQNISHWHTDLELVYVNKGELDVMVEGTNYLLKKGNSLLIDSKKIHNMHAQKEDTLVSIFIFDQSLINKTLQNYQLESPLLKHNYNLEDLYSLLFEELTKKPDFYAENTKLLIQSLLVDIYRKEQLIKVNPNKKMNENLLNLIEQINSNFQYFKFEDAVKIMNMNPSYFSRYFHNMIGISFAKYLNCVKIEKAVELIHESKNKTMTEISDTCGFQTIRNFNRIFKNYTGYSPTNIPNDYVFNGLKYYYNSNLTNPTLNSCKLIEFSSPHN